MEGLLDRELDGAVLGLPDGTNDGALDGAVVGDGVGGMLILVSIGEVVGALVPSQ